MSRETIAQIARTVKREGSACRFFTRAMTGLSVTDPAYHDLAGRRQTEMIDYYRHRRILTHAVA